MAAHRRAQRRCDLHRRHVRPLPPPRPGPPRPRRLPHHQAGHGRLLRRRRRGVRRRAAAGLRRRPRRPSTASPGSSPTARGCSRSAAAPAATRPCSSSAACPCAAPTSAPASSGSCVTPATTPIVIDPLVDDLADPEHDAPYDGVWASASLLHVRREDLPAVLRNLASVTRDGGVLHLAVKEGDGARFSVHGNVPGPRHFTFWREEGLRAVLAAAGWDVRSLARSVGQRGETWLDVTALRSDEVHRALGAARGGARARRTPGPGPAPRSSAPSAAGPWWPRSTTATRPRRSGARSGTCSGCPRRSDERPDEQRRRRRGPPPDAGRPWSWRRRVGGIGITIGVATASLLAREVSGSEGQAGLAQTSQVLGAAAASFLLARLMARRGRRVGQVTGLSVGAAGAALCVVAGVVGSMLLLLVGALLLGSTTAANAAARYAATDLAPERTRARSLALVVWATTAGRGRRPQPDRSGHRAGRLARDPRAHRAVRRWPRSGWRWPRWSSRSRSGPIRCSSPGSWPAPTSASPRAPRGGAPWPRCRADRALAAAALGSPAPTR